MVIGVADQFELLDKLGSGGMGEVFRARDTRLGRIVAVKVLSKDSHGDRSKRRRFFQEAQAASALNHPNIVTIHDVVSEGGSDLIVMECVNGKTLSDLIPKSGLRVPQIINYGLQITDALIAAHAAGIVHRDLKPGNIMVTDSGLVKVLDFGLAKMTTPPAEGEDPEATRGDAPLTVEGSIIGTVAYMSPEQAEGRRVDARSDIFSLGAVFYEMATGQRAFGGHHAISTLTAVLRDETRPIFEIAPDVPLELDILIQCCLRKNPDERSQSMREVHDALLQLKEVSDSGTLYRSVLAPPLAKLGRTPVKPPPPPPSTQAPLTQAPLTQVPVSVTQGPPTQVPVTQVPVVAGPILPPPPPVGPRPSQAAPAKKASGKKASAWPVILGTAALVVLLAGGGLFWWFTQQQPKTAPVPQATAVTPPPVVAPPQSAPQLNPQPAPPETVLKNDSILDLVRAKVPDSLIISQIQSNKTDFNLSSPELIRLVQGGVSPAVIETMRNPTRTPAPSPTVAANQKGKPAPPLNGTPPPNAKSTNPAPTNSSTPSPAAPPPSSPSPVVSEVSPAPQEVSVTATNGTPLLLSLAEDVSRDAAEGSPLHFVVAGDLKVNGVVVIRKGASAIGAIVDDPKKRKVFGGTSKGTYRLQSVEAVDGKQLRIRATPAASSGEGAKRPLEVKKSKAADVVAARGTEYPAYLDGDAVVSGRR